MSEQTTHIHDPDSWDFSEALNHPEYYLAGGLRNLWPILYWTMRIGDSILEVGAGSGKGCILAKKLSPQKRVVALDISAKACEVIRQYAALTNTDLEVRQGDALKLPFADKEFGLAFSVGVLEHYPDEWILAALREQCRVAEVIIVSVPLDLYMYTYAHTHGDERPLSKGQWFNLINQVADYVDMSFTGTPTEETGFIAVVIGRNKSGSN